MKLSGTFFLPKAELFWLEPVEADSFKPLVSKILLYLMDNQ